MNRKELLGKLLKADEEISMMFEPSHKVDVVIGGGSVLIIRNLISRQTPDIDTIGFYSELENVFNKYDMNSRMNAFSDCLPENYENRLEKIELPTKAINYYMLSLEDLVLMKLFSHRGKDLNDISDAKVLATIDWSLLDKIVIDGELDNSFNERRYKEFLDKFNAFKEKKQKQ